MSSRRESGHTGLAILSVSFCCLLPRPCARQTSSRQHNPCLILSFLALRPPVTPTEAVRPSHAYIPRGCPTAGGTTKRPLCCRFPLFAPQCLHAALSWIYRPGAGKEEAYSGQRYPCHSRAKHQTVTTCPPLLSPSVQEHPLHHAILHPEPLQVLLLPPMHRFYRV